LNGGGTDNVGFAPTAQDVISNMIYWANDGHILKTFDQIAQSMTN
jgi:hypothetical protein